MVFKLGYVYPLGYMKTVLKARNQFLHLQLPCVLCPQNYMPGNINSSFLTALSSLAQVRTLLRHLTRDIKLPGHQRAEPLDISWSECKETCKK